MASNSQMTGSQKSPVIWRSTARWPTLDEIAAASPAELRKGPRGGGRDRDQLIGHVIGADTAYARKLGVKSKQPAIGDIAGIEELREAIVAVVVGAPSDGAPVCPAAGPHATRPAGSPGTSSNTSGRCKTGPTARSPAGGTSPALQANTTSWARSHAPTGRPPDSPCELRPVGSQRTRLVTFVPGSWAGFRVSLERRGAQAPSHWFQHTGGVMVQVKQAAAESWPKSASR